MSSNRSGQAIDHVRRNPAGLAPPNQFSHVVGAGDLYFLSGQVARGDDGRVVGPGDMAAQTRQSFANLAVLLLALAPMQVGDAQAGMFVGGGFLALVSLLGLVRYWLRRSAAGGPLRMNLPRLGLLNARRYPLRSVLTIGLVASLQTSAGGSA